MRSVSSARGVKRLRDCTHRRVRKGRAPWEAFKDLLDASNTPARRAQIDLHLRQAAEEISLEMFTENDVQSYTTIKNAMSGRLQVAGLDVYHGVPKKIVRSA